MTLADWISIAGVFVALFGVAVAVAAWLLNARAQKAGETALSEQAGRHRERLDALERWQRDKSIDRSEHLGLSKRMEDMEADLLKRVEGIEIDVAEAAKAVSDVRVQMAAIPAELKSIRDLMERDNREFRHDISGLKASMEKIADLFTRERRAALP